MTVSQAIWHGDARDLVAQLPAPIDCIIVDPPYGMAFRSNSAQLPSGKRWVRDIEGDDNLDGALELFAAVMRPLMGLLSEEADVYVFTRWTILGPWCDAVAELGLAVTNCLVWDKGTPGMGDVKGNWGNTHELIIYAKHGRRSPPERRSSIIAVDRVDNHSHVHPTQKPVPLLEVLLRMSTQPGDLVVDPFCGSGSTVVAAQRLGRAAIGIELDAEHARNARERLSQPVMPL